MGMLTRIKKRQFDGFKEFVQNLETTGAQSRSQIFITGLLEDPLYMSWVTKNIKTIDDFLQMPSDEISMVVGLNDQMVSIFAKSLFGRSPEFYQSLDKVIPKFYGRLKEELSYFTQVQSAEKESASYYLIKATRKLQNEESISGFGWRLPSIDLFNSRPSKDGDEKIYFDNGVLAAEGESFRGKRTNNWKHYYETGQLLAEGEWFDGLKIGPWRFYYSNGKLKSEGRFKLDLKSGFWIEYDRQGMATEQEFREGVRVES